MPSCLRVEIDCFNWYILGAFDWENRSLRLDQIFVAVSTYKILGRISVKTKLRIQLATKSWLVSMWEYKCLCLSGGCCWVTSEGEEMQESVRFSVCGKSGMMEIGKWKQRKKIEAKWWYQKRTNDGYHIRKGCIDIGINIDRILISELCISYSCKRLYIQDIVH